jgi:hypothetical protein
MYTKYALWGLSEEEYGCSTVTKISVEHFKEA